ncbi:MAG: hypothetical protein QOE90_3067 [Thermoplasmata archaeon]|jgi:hypothetical protein|nr:hypothetical protein [Thermoplasmata archaeon]
MRPLALAIFLALLLLSPAALAQQQGAPPSGCGRGGFGGGGAGGGFRNRTGNRTQDGGGFGSFTRLDTIAFSFDPAGPLDVAPGGQGDVKVTLTSNGSTDLTLELLASSGFRPRNDTSAAPPPVEATLDAANLTVPAGGSASATMHVVVSRDTPVGCQLGLMVLARDPTTNATAAGRIQVQIVPGDATPAAATPAAAQAEKRSPLPVLAPLAGLALAALARRRS